jgi:hypothetical protein
VTAYLDELRDVIRRLHGVESSHIKSVPVKEFLEVRRSGKAQWKYLSCTAILKLRGSMHGRMKPMTQIIRSDTLLFYIFRQPCQQ